MLLPSVPSVSASPAGTSVPSLRAGARGSSALESPEKCGSGIPRPIVFCFFCFLWIPSSSFFLGGGSGELKDNHPFLEIALF